MATNEEILSELRKHTQDVGAMWRDIKELRERVSVLEHFRVTIRKELDGNGRKGIYERLEMIEEKQAFLLLKYYVFTTIFSLVGGVLGFIINKII